MTTQQPQADATAFLEDLRSGIGLTTPERLTPDEVNQPMIRHWCQAMTDANPIYADPQFAATSVHGEIVAPPAMMDTWTMVGLGSYRNIKVEGDPAAGMLPVLNKLDDAGFTSVVATNTIHEYRRYLRLGDRLRTRQAITNVSAEKQTALGTGHFFTTATEFIDQNDETVGRMEFTILKFKPGTGSIQMPESFDNAPNAQAGAAPDAMLRPAPAVSHDTRFFWDGIDHGELRIQQCSACETLAHPPLVRCATCGSYDFGYKVASGRGTVYSFVEVEHPKFPFFEYPLLVVLVELEEGTRIVSNLLGVNADQVRVGMPVELAIEAPDGKQQLPIFRPARPPREETTRRFDSVTVGDILAPCPLAITPTLIVAGAMASRDFQDVHHDPNLARKRGSPDIFMNIMTTGGHTTRYVTDWAGPEALVRRMQLRLGAPNYPGDTMTYFGEVKSAEIRDGKGVVEIGVNGTNRYGEHVRGTFELELPR